MKYLLFVQYHKKLTLTQRISLCRNNNIRSRQKLNHPKKQPIVNIRRLNDEQQKMYSNLSIDERHTKKELELEAFSTNPSGKERNLLWIYFYRPNGEFAVNQRYV